MMSQIMLLEPPSENQIFTKNTQRTFTLSVQHENSLEVLVKLNIQLDRK